jgi:hypothetical protein
MKYFHCLVFLLTVSCVEDNGMHQADQGMGENYIEICHNPLSKNHKGICTEQCFVPNQELYSFCWTLKKSDCILPLEHEWQQENCHFFD